MTEEMKKAVARELAAAFLDYWEKRESEEEEKKT